MSHRRSPPSPRPPLSLALTSVSSSGHSNWTHPSPSAHSFSAWVEREGEEPHPRCGSLCARSPHCPVRSCPRPYRGSLFRASPLYSSTERSNGWSRRASTGSPTVCSITRPWPRLQARGELTPAQLASRILNLAVFHRITAEDFRVLLRHLLQIGHVEQTETGGLIVGISGERLTSSYKFYAVFQENIEYTVRSDSTELGTIVSPPPNW